MARNQKKRQKALAKQRKKTKRQRPSAPHLGAAASDRALIRRGREFPIRECLGMRSGQGTGLDQLTIARNAPDGRIVFAVFLVDTFCLGVKNAFCDIVPLAAYEREVKPKIYRDGTPRRVPVDHFHHLIYGAVDYARQFGFEPHADFRFAQNVLEPREQFPSNPDVEFGRDGKPFYISGPHDNVEHILAALDRNPGEGNYDYLVGGPVGAGP